jgi:hypothetical protein
MGAGSRIPKRVQLGLNTRAEARNARARPNLGLYVPAFQGYSGARAYSQWTETWPFQYANNVGKKTPNNLETHTVRGN